MTHFTRLLRFTLPMLVPLPMTLWFMLGIAWAEDGKFLSAEELEVLIKGGTRVGTYSAGKYFITFKEDGNYCLRLNRKDEPCYEEGPWWFEGNTVCRNSPNSGEYCWNVTRLSDNNFSSEVTRVKNSRYKVGSKSKFWME